MNVKTDELRLEKPGIDHGLCFVITRAVAISTKWSLYNATQHEAKQDPALNVNKHSEMHCSHVQSK